MISTKITKILMSSLILATLGGLSLFTISCSGGKSKPNVELIQDMMEGPNIKAQEGEGDQPTVMMPPENSIPRNRYVDADLTLEEAQSLKNPLDSISGEELLKYEVIGQEKFNIYCSVCHGDKGDGNGSLVKISKKSLVKLPPNIVQDTYKKYSDARLYYIITYGWGLMGSYSSQISDEKDRWAVVNYLRQLQKLNSGQSNKTDESGD